MSDLAFNMNGEPFELPPTMAAWRVRKLKPKGAPEVVYGRDGLPLFLPLDADIEDLRREARADGRYRLDPVDDHNRSVPNAQSSYVCVHPMERAPEPPPPPAPSLASVQADTTAALVAALLESQKQHTELARMYVSQFPVLANAMAGVVRSAGDVGLTARVPLVVPALPEARPDDSKREIDEDEIDDDEIDEDEIDDDETGDGLEPEPAYSWPRVAQTFAEYVGPHVGPLLAGIPGLGAMLGAQPSRPEPDAAPGPGPRDPAPADPASGGPASGFDPSLAIRLRTILAQLTPAEQVFAKSLLQEIPADQMPGWIERLRAMSVAEAVAYVRQLLEAARAAAATAPSAGPASTPPTAPPSAAPPREAYRAASPRDMRRAHAAPSAAGRAASTDAPSDDIPLLDSATQAHLAAIDRALTLEESAAMRKHFGSLSARDRAGWVATLLTLPVVDAVAMIRAQLAGHAPGAPAASGARAAQSSETAATAGKPRDGSPTNRAASKPTTSSAKPSASPRAPRNHTIASPATTSSPSVTPATASPADPAATPPTTTSLDSANPLAPATATATELPTAMPVDTTVETGSAMPRDVDRNAHTHLADVENALAPEERLLVHSMIAGLSPEDREAWLDQLLSVPAAQGAALLRDTLRELTTQDIPVEAPAETRAAESNDEAPIIEELGDDEGDDQVTGDDREEEERPGDTAHAAASTRSAIAKSGALPTLDEASLAHFKAIEDALTFAEQMRAHELAAQRSATELRRWYAELRALAVPDAVAKIRAELARSHRDPNASNEGGVS